MVNHPNRSPKVAVCTPDQLKRLREQKEAYDKANQEAARIAAEERKLEAKEAREAGHRWALDTATYEEALGLGSISAFTAYHRRGDGPEGDHSFSNFQEGVNEVLKELRDA